MRLTVLIVDDSEVVRRVLAMELRREFAVLQADGVEEGLRMLALPGTTTSAVVADNWLPDGTGLELLAEVRRRAPVCARILISGELPATCDADAMIPKPWKPGAALAAVREALALG